MLPNSWEVSESCDPFCSGFLVWRVFDLNSSANIESEVRRVRRFSLEQPGLGLSPRTGR